MEKEHRNMNEQYIETEDNKKENNNIEIEDNTQENEEKYAKEEENTTSIKEPDITTGFTRNNHDILPYTKDKC